MNRNKRLHPLTMLYQLWSSLTTLLVIGLYLFIIKRSADSMLIYFGRISFIIICGLTILFIVWKWLTYSYRVDNHAFYLTKGVLSKSQQSIPFSNIQQTSRYTSLFHKLFHVTSIKFETGINSDTDFIRFDVITHKEAAQLEKLIKQSDAPTNIKIQDNNKVLDKTESLEKPKKNQHIHFKSTSKDIFRASYSSLSFIIVIPLIFSIYTKLVDILDLNVNLDIVLDIVFQSRGMMLLSIFILLGICIIFGWLRTIIKYGKYQISSDRHYIYIKRGIVEEVTFSIAKERVQSIEIKQSPLQRLLKQAKVNLISSGTNRHEGNKQVNTLYPFLSEEKVDTLLAEIMSNFSISKTMNKLPKTSCWLQIFKMSWIGIISSLVLFFIKPNFYGINWWMMSIILFILIITRGTLNYHHSRYTINKEFIQIKKGALFTTTQISMRSKIMEVTVKENIFQQKLGLSSVQTVIQTKPVQITCLHDVPISFTNKFLQWYSNRYDDVKIE